MKKLALLLAAGLAFTGLIGAGPANATTTAYPGSVGTKIASVQNLPSGMKQHTRAVVRVTVTARSGNARPAAGTLRVWIIRNGHITNVIDNRVRNGVAHFTFMANRKGHFKLIINYLPPRSSVWKFASTTRYVTVH